MKVRPVRTSPLIAITRLAAGIIALLALLVAYLFFVAGPSLDVKRVGAAVHVEARFLEYQLGLERLQLIDPRSGSVILSVSSVPGTTFESEVTFAAGENDIGTLLGPEAKILVPSNGRLVLSRGVSYHLRVWGNNGFGRVRSSSARFVL